VSEARERLVVFGGVRTPFSRAGSDFASHSAADLAVVAIRELLHRLGVEGKEIDEVVLGCVGSDAGEANVARVAALRAGIPTRVPAVTVSRNCASGFESVTTAAERLAAGQGSLFVVGGTESMSSYPLQLSRRFARVLDRVRRAKGLPAKAAAVAQLRPAALKPRVSLIAGLTDPISGMIMGSTAERLALDFGLSREEQDRFACESQNRAERAADRGRFASEIVPLFALDEESRDAPRYRAVERDNGIRPGQTMEALARLRPVFDRGNGTVTVGNSSQVTDGACALLVGSESRGRALGLRPMGRLLAHAYAGCEPSRMGLGPVYASPFALDRAGVSFDRIGLVELNEAFAAQVLACLRAFASAEFARREFGRTRAIGEIDPERLNPNGGAIALGHPVGATGSRLVLTLLQEMRDRDVSLGLATLCVGGGQGGAIVLERWG